MALYRQVYINFWTDSKVEDDFTPEDKYFYLYLLTNPHTNLCGCYECSIKQMARETGYNEDTIKRLINRMETVHDVIRYDDSTKEVLILNWHKYNWSKSDKVIANVEKSVNAIKSEDFADYVASVLGEIDGSEPPTRSRKTEETKHKHGEYGHVRLTDEQMDRILNELGEAKASECIRILDEYLQTSNRTYKDHYLVIMKKDSWVQREADKACRRPNSVVDSWRDVV